MIGKSKYTYHNGVSYNMVWRRGGGCVTKIKTPIWKWPQGHEIVTKVSVVNKVLIGPLYKYVKIEVQLCIIFDSIVHT